MSFACGTISTSSLLSLFLICRNRIGDDPRPANQNHARTVILNHPINNDDDNNKRMKASHRREAVLLLLLKKMLLFGVEGVEVPIFRSGATTFYIL